MEWNEDTIARLRALWAEGHSTAEIGRRMAVSKNAVVGKAHRLGLAPRPSPIRRDGPAGGVPKMPQPRRVVGPTLPPLPVPAERTPTVAAELQMPSPAAAALPPDEPAADPSPSMAAAPNLEAPAIDTPAPVAPAPVAPAPVATVLVSPMPVSPVVAATMRVVSPPRSARHVACCWPIGEPGTKSFRFCDEDAVAGKPYCAAHSQLAYVKVRDRREEAA